ncbi:MAG: HAMP domain-containing protein [Chloroflexi bacterium]|nr:HAMP domain-containing protein [Chloroflexota bacterium]
MRIRTQFLFTMAIFGMMLLIIATSVIITNQEVERLSIQEEIARNVERGASDLSYLSNDYFFYRERQQRARWESRFATFSNDVSKLKPESAEQQALVNNIKANQQRLKAVFADVVPTVESVAQGATTTQGSIQVAWSRMTVQIQGIVFDAMRLSQTLRDHIDGLKQRNIILIFTLLGIFGAYFLTNYLIVYRRTLRSISELHAGTTIVGSGNLDYAIAVRHDNEIGELSRAFNRMTANLKSVTALKAEMEREIAEREKAEAELELSNRELEAFAYSVSHDLRAPLRHIDGFSVILQQDYADRLDAPGKQLLQFLRDGSARMAQLIDDLLKLSRVTRGEMRRQPVDMSELAESILADLHKEQPERQLESTVAPDLVVDADPQLLHIVLDNLLGNAWKFTSRRPVARIELGVTRHDDKPVYYVKDNGAGFDATYAGKLFGPFQRLHSTEEYPGTGIGLATVQRIIRRHGGRVWADGIVDEGATFYFAL